MNHSQRILILTSCLAVSMLGHTLLLSSFGLLGRLDFATPVRNLPVVEIDLRDRNLPEPERPEAEAEEADAPEEPVAGTVAQGERDREPSTVSDKVEPRENSAAHIPASEAAIAPVAEKQSVDSTPDIISPVAAVRNRTPFVLDPPLRISGEFLGISHEKLVYRISMLGMPVGSAELEANNEKGEVRITLRVRSDAVLSTIYPVDDLVETRHINGNYILSRIRQQEGDFRGDRGFTLFYETKVSS